MDVVMVGKAIGYAVFFGMLMFPLGASCVTIGMDSMLALQEL